MGINPALQSFLDSKMTPAYSSIEELLNFCLKYSPLYIYGVGVLASSIHKYLKIIEIDISGYVVSDERIDSYSELFEDGIPILSVSQTALNKEAGFILALPDIYHNTAFENLKRRAFYNIFILREYDKQAINEKLRIPSLDSFYFFVNIVNHCNLGCSMCVAFAQLAKEHYMDLSSFKNDMIKIRELSEGRYMGGVFLTGGEPLLHPMLNSFVLFLRKCFPLGSLGLFTNGLKLLKMDDAFWSTLRECDFSIILTKYPINLDYENIISTAEKYGVAIYSASNILDVNSTPEQKLMNKYPFDMRGKQNIGNFVSCYSFNNCRILVDGKLYTCSTLPGVEKFNSYFKKDLAVSEVDYLDIHEINKFEDISNFVIKPPLFCRYCDVKNRRPVGGWALSKKSIDEYID